MSTSLPCTTTNHKVRWHLSTFRLRAGMSFDIRQLRYAIAAADHGSFYRAARALGIEQSTLSRAILRLERSIGMPIFERSRAGVTQRSRRRSGHWRD